MRIKDGLLSMLDGKAVYTLDVGLFDKYGIYKEGVSERVLAEGADEARDILYDYLSEKYPEMELKFSKYNPIKIEELSDILIDALGDVIRED